jgi:hypothetical protein
MEPLKDKAAKAVLDALTRRQLTLTQIRRQLPEDLVDYLATKKLPQQVGTHLGQLMQLVDTLSKFTNEVPAQDLMDAEVLDRNLSRIVTLRTAATGLVQDFVQDHELIASLGVPNTDPMLEVIRRSHEELSQIFGELSALQEMFTDRRSKLAD